MTKPHLTLAQSFPRFYALLVGGAVLGIVVIQQVLKRSPQSSRQLLLLSNKLDDISKRVSTSPVHQQTSAGPCLSPIMVQESSGAGRLQVDEPDYAPQQDATATANATAVRNINVSYLWTRSLATVVAFTCVALCVCVCACVRACVRASVRVCVCVCMGVTGVSVSLPVFFPYGAISKHAVH